MQDQTVTYVGISEHRDHIDVGKSRGYVIEVQRTLTAKNVLVRQPLTLGNVLRHVRLDQQCQQVSILQVLAFDSIFVHFRRFAQNSSFPLGDKLHTNTLDNCARAENRLALLGRLTHTSYQSAANLNISPNQISTYDTLEYREPCC